jgi:hypothetical protein
MKRCLICLAEEDDGRTYVQETYCKRCLESDIGTLRHIHLKSLAAKERAKGTPANEDPKPR